MWVKTRVARISTMATTALACGPQKLVSGSTTVNYRKTQFGAINYLSGRGQKSTVAEVELWRVKMGINVCTIVVVEWPAI